MSPADVSPGRDGEIVISDPRAIRALAHPARVAVLERLFSGAVLTATECAEVAGLTPSAMSYHLRALEKYGLVARAESTGDGRERPWRALGTDVRVQADSTLAGRAAEQVFFGRVMDRMRAEVEAARAHRHALGDAANDRPSAFAMSGVRLTAAEVRELSDRVDALVAPYAARGDVPPEALEYHVYWAAAPALPAAPDDATPDDAAPDEG